MKNKAFFFDIDGTLCYEGERGLVLPGSTKKSIEVLVEKGYKVFVATGRPEIFLPKLVLDNVKDGIVCANGSVVKVNDEVVYEKLVPYDVVKKVMDYCKEDDLLYMFEGDRAYVEDVDNKVIRKFLEHISFKESPFSDSYDKETSKIYNIVIIGTSDYSKAKSLLGDEFLYARHSFAEFLDIYYKDSTKADGIDRIIEHLGLEDYETYAFGDGENDLQMISRVDFGVAMGNACDELKELATYVTTDVKEDGIYNALKHLGIIE